MRKLYILYVVIIVSILSSLCIIDNDTSALSYESSVSIGFTFNPTLSVSLSSSDLVISNLTPGSSANSNSINVSVATNAAYGYTLSANANSEDLVHSNNINTFSSVAIDADLSSLDDSEDNNIWGYSTSLNNGSSWSNYNGLSSSTSTTLIDNSNTADSTGSIDFKIGARAGSTQASGIYANTINFIAVSKVAPMSLLDSFIASGAEQLNGYYKMQDMTHSICSNVDIEESELQLIDIRDNKIYWVAKLKDGNCWMTQNLDLDIMAGTTNITSDNTDLSTNETVYTDSNTIYALKGESDTYGYTYENGLATWIPERSTIAYNNLSSITWQTNSASPNSYDRLNIANGDPVYPDNNVTQTIAGNHGLSGNYYNWAATIASNNSTKASNDSANSICPKNWRLPSFANKDFGNLLVAYNIIITNTSASYVENISSVNSLSTAPLYIIRNGDIDYGSLYNSGSFGEYWSSTGTGEQVYYLRFDSGSINPRFNNSGRRGFSIRCIAR